MAYVYFLKPLESLQGDWASDLKQPLYLFGFNAHALALGAINTGNIRGMGKDSNSRYRNIYNDPFGLVIG